MNTNKIFKAGFLFLGILFLLLGIQVKAQNTSSVGEILFIEEPSPGPDYWSYTQKLDDVSTKTINDSLKKFIPLYFGSAVTAKFDSITEIATYNNHIKLSGYGDVTGNFDDVTSLSVEIDVTPGEKPLSIFSPGVFFVAVNVLKSNDAKTSEVLFHNIRDMIQKLK